MKVGRKRRSNLLRRVMVISFFLVAFLWIGSHLHLIAEQKKNVLLKARERELSLQIEELAKEIEKIKESRTR